MNKYLESLRQTGRTTRMIEHARKLNSQGRAVYILAANEMERNRIKDLVGKGTGIKVESTHLFPSWNWESLTLRAAHPNCVVLVDHFAIESKFSRILDMLHAYDQTEG